LAPNESHVIFLAHSLTTHQLYETEFIMEE